MSDTAFEPTLTMQSIWTMHVNNSPPEKIGSRLGCKPSYVLEVIASMARRMPKGAAKNDPPPRFVKGASVVIEDDEKPPKVPVTALDVAAEAANAPKRIKQKIRERMNLADRRILKMLYEAPNGMRSIDMAEKAGMSMTAIVGSLSSILTDAGVVRQGAESAMWIVSDRELADEFLRDAAPPLLRTGQTGLACMKVIADNGGKATEREICALTKIKRNAIVSALRRLAARGRIERIGGKRGAWSLRNQAGE